jgi:hypothetical protein
MKKMTKYIWTVSIAGISAFFSSCAGTQTCNNDACYDRKISSVDPFKKGDIAAWGSEKAMAEQEEEKEYKEHRVKRTGVE